MRLYESVNIWKYTSWHIYYNNNNNNNDNNNNNNHEVFDNWLSTDCPVKALESHFDSG